MHPTHRSEFSACFTALRLLSLLLIAQILPLLSPSTVDARPLHNTVAMPLAQASQAVDLGDETEPDDTSATATPLTSNSQTIWQWLGATMTNSEGNPTVTTQEAAGWGVRHADISTFAGKLAELVFHLDSDTTVQLTSLAIDDVKVTEYTPPPDLTITKTVTPTTVSPGQTITYTLAFSNIGIGPAYNVALTDTMPAEVLNPIVVSSGATITDTGTVPAYVWDVQPLLPGQGGLITVTGQVDPALSTSIFTNTAMIMATGDITPTNNSASVGVQVLANVPEVAILGNGRVIANGDATPTPADDTDFGSIPLGQAITHTFTISNNSSAALDLAGTPLVAISGPDAGEFSVVADPTTPIGPGQSSTFQVRFTTSAIGLRTATVTVLVNDSDKGAYSFAIQGNGTNAAPIADAGADQFIGVGTLVTLDGSGSSDPDGHTPLSYGWSQAGGPPVSLSGAGSASPTFTAPAASTVLAFSLAVTDSLGLSDLTPDTMVITVTASPPDIAVLGNGQLIADGDTSPTTSDHTDFGSLAVGQAITHTFTISNSGGVALSLTGAPLVAIGGPAAGDFSVVVDPTTPVGPGLSTTFQVRFRPSASGIRAAAMTILNNDGDENAYSFAIQGTGMAIPSATTSHIYLPLVLRDFVSAPDLVVESISASSSGVTVVIKNIGNAPVFDAFWVDVYFNPSQRPIYNQQWEQIAPAGAVWGINNAGLSQLTPGGSLALTSGGAYYSTAESSAMPFPAGAQVYAQVDSVNPATSYGAVRESDEANNILGPVSSSPNSSAQATTETAPQVLEGLPKR